MNATWKCPECGTLLTVDVIAPVHTPQGPCYAATDASCKTCGCELDDDWSLADDANEIKRSVIAELESRGPCFDGGFEATRKELADEWLDEFEGREEEISDWMAAGFWCPVTARQARRLGIKPDEVAARCNDNITGFDDPVYAMCNNDLAVDAMIACDD